MTAANSLYPALGKYFETQTELAHAGCMSRTRLSDCLAGLKDFKRCEKKAISANIAMKLMNSKSFDYAELEDANRAYMGKFDEIYKRKDV